MLGTDNGCCCLAPKLIPTSSGFYILFLDKLYEDRVGKEEKITSIFISHVLLVFRRNERMESVDEIFIHPPFSTSFFLSFYYHIVTVHFKGSKWKRGRKNERGF